MRQGHGPADPGWAGRDALAVPVVHINRRTGDLGRKWRSDDWDPGLIERNSGRARPRLSVFRRAEASRMRRAMGSRRQKLRQRRCRFGQTEPQLSPPTARLLRGRRVRPGLISAEVADQCRG